MRGNFEFGGSKRTFWMPVRAGVKTCRGQGGACEPGCESVGSRCFPTRESRRINLANDDKESQATLARYYALMAGVVALIGALFLAVLNDTFPFGKGSSVRTAQAVAGVLYLATGAFMLMARKASERAGARSVYLEAGIAAWSIMLVLSGAVWVLPSISSHLAVSLLAVSLFAVGVVAFFAWNSSTTTHSTHSTHSTHAGEEPIPLKEPMEHAWWFYSLVVLGSVGVIGAVAGGVAMKRKHDLRATK